MIDPKKPMAVVEIPYEYQTVVLNADEAYALFKVLANAMPVEHRYSEGYRVKQGRDRPSLKAFTLEDHAQLALNSTD